MKLRDASLQVYEKTLSRIFFHVFYLNFLRMLHDDFFQRGFEAVSTHNFIQRNVVLLVIYLFHHDSSKSLSSRQEVFCEKGVLRNFTKFTGKHLCQSLFFNKVAGLRPQELSLELNLRSSHCSCTIKMVFLEIL